LGRLLEAEADARAALDAVGEWRHGPVPALTGSVLAGSLTAQGRFEEARAVLNETPVPAAQSATFFALESRGRLSLAIGDYEQAAREFAHYDELDLRARNAVPARPETVGLIPHRSLWARALIACGEVAQAGELLETELSLARELGTHRAVGMALHVAGLLEHGEIQLRLLGEATETLAQSQSRLAYIDALCDHGAALRRANRRADARRPLTAALQIAREAHARPLQERAAQELKATGARVSRPHATGIEALTASEQRVASMAADGMSNREIAQGLFVTIKTVETHLGRVYQKLDLSSRSQLSTALTDHSATA
jgi:DNA-binding CsgD family transcriptional regulator